MFLVLMGLFKCFIGFFLYEAEHLILFSWGISCPSIFPVHVVSFLGLSHMFYPFARIKHTIWTFDAVRTLDGTQSIILCCRMVIFAHTNWCVLPFHSDPFPSLDLTPPPHSNPPLAFCQTLVVLILCSLANTCRPHCLFSVSLFCSHFVGARGRMEPKQLPPLSGLQQQTCLIFILIILEEVSLAFVKHFISVFNLLMWNVDTNKCTICKENLEWNN